MLGFVNSLRWLFFAKIATISIQATSLIYLTRLLSPYEFGIFAFTVILKNLITPVLDLGFSQDYIVSRKFIKLKRDLFYSINFYIGVLISIILCLFSESIVRFFDESDLLRSHIYILALSILFVAVSAQPRAQLKKKNDYRTLSLIELVVAIFGNLGAILLAYLGFGIWSLFYKLLSDAFLTYLLLKSLAPQNVALLTPFTVLRMRVLLSFGTKIFANRLIANWINASDKLLMASFGSTQLLGAFNRSGQLVLFLDQGIRTAITSPLLSHVAASRGNDKEDYYGFAVGLIFVLITLPLICATFVDSEIISLIFGKNWEEYSWVFSIAALLTIARSYQGLATIINLQSFDTNSTLFFLIGNGILNITLPLLFFSFHGVLVWMFYNIAIGQVLYWFFIVSYLIVQKNIVEKADAIFIYILKVFIIFSMVGCVYLSLGTQHYNQFWALSIVSVIYASFIIVIGMCSVAIYKWKKMNA